MYALQRLATAYLTARLTRREISRETYQRQVYVLRGLADTFGNRDVKNLSKHDIERWIDSRASVTKATLRTDMCAVRRFVWWLQIEGKIRHNPMIEIQAPKLPRSVPRALEADQTDVIWAVLPDARARAIVALMLWGGLRRCEVIRLGVGDWNRREQSLHVTGKGNHERDVPVTERVEAALAAYLAESRSVAGPMIRQHDSREPLTKTYLSRLVRGWMEAAGVKELPGDGKGCHSFRHTLASNVADVEGVDLRVVQEMLGHAHLSSTQVYLRRVKLEQLRAAMEAAA